MKAYTDIEQARKLAEILPLESSDMSYDWFVIGKNTAVFHNVENS